MLQIQNLKKREVNSEPTDIQKRTIHWGQGERAVLLKNEVTGSMPIFMQGLLLSLKLFQSVTLPKTLPSLLKSRTINYRWAWTRSWDLKNRICFWEPLIHVQNLLLVPASQYLRTECVRMGLASAKVQAVWIWRPLLFHLYNYYFSLSLTHVCFTGWIQAAGYKPTSWEVLSLGSCRILPEDLGSLSPKNNVGWKVISGVRNLKGTLRNLSFPTFCPVMSCTM